MKGTTSLIRRRTVPVKPAKLPATTAGPSLADFRSPFTWFTKPGRVTGRVFRGPASRRTLPPSPLVAAPKRPDKSLVAEERMDGRALPDGTVLRSMHNSHRDLKLSTSRASRSVGLSIDVRASAGIDVVVTVFV